MKAFFFKSIKLFASLCFFFVVFFFVFVSWSEVLMKSRSWVWSLEGLLLSPIQKMSQAVPELTPLSVSVTSQNCVSFANLDEEVLVISRKPAKLISQAHQQYLGSWFKVSSWWVVGWPSQLLRAAFWSQYYDYMLHLKHSNGGNVRSVRRKLPSALPCPAHRQLCVSLHVQGTLFGR